VPSQSPRGWGLSLLAPSSSAPRPAHSITTVRRHHPRRAGGGLTWFDNTIQRGEAGDGSVETDSGSFGRHPLPHFCGLGRSMHCLSCYKSGGTAGGGTDGGSV
jgi:hypothetical protein